MSKTHNADTRRRTWRYIAIACVLGVFMLVIFGAYRRINPVIAFSSGIKLQLLAEMTHDQPNFRIPSPGESLRQFLPYKLQSFLFPIREDRHSINTVCDIRNPTGAEAIWKLDYPPEWSQHTNDLRAKIWEELENEGINAYRVKLGPGSYIQDAYLDFEFEGEDDSVTPGIPGPAWLSVLAKMRFEELPVFQKYLTIQIINQKYYGQPDPAVVREISMVNPVYRQVTPLKSAVNLPAMVSHDDLEVHLRALVIKLKPGVSFTESNQDGTGAGYFIKNNPIPDSGPIPPKCFVRGDESNLEGYRSAAVLQILRNGKPQSEWGLRNVRFTYGLEGFDVPDNNRIRRGGRNLIIDELPGDLSLFPQPLKASVSLIHLANFSPDEAQTFQFPLPKEGESFDPKTSFTLWDGQYIFKNISYKKSYHIDKYNYTSSHHFTIIINGKSSIGNFVEIKFLGPNGASDSISKRFVNGRTIGDVSYVSYELSNGYPASALKDYADYTTVSLTLQHPQNQNFTFDFITSPAEATGKL